MPSTREVAADLNADPRVVSLAYRDLAMEGLVEMRVRSGAYLARGAAQEIAERRPPRASLAEFLADGVCRGFSTSDSCDYLREAALSRKISVAVVATTLDQTEGMSRELRADYGLSTTGVLAEALEPSARLPVAIRRANFILTTHAHGALVKQLARHLGKPFIVAAVRPDVVRKEWLRFLERKVFVIAIDQRFLSLVKEYLADKPGSQNVIMLMAGRDDLSKIPPDAPTYVTQAARERLGKTRIPGRLIPPATVFADDCVREITEIIVNLNTKTWREK